MKKVILAAAAFIGFAVSANAQTSSTATQNVSLSLSNAIELTFTGSGNNTGTAVELPFTTVANYADGVASTSQQLKVRSNKKFNVTVKANATNFTYTGSTTPAPAMPVADVLKVQVSDNQTGGTIAAPFTGYSALTTTDQALLNTCNNGGGQLFSIQYKATPGFTYPAGSYKVEVAYTATQP